MSDAIPLSWGCKAETLDALAPLLTQGLTLPRVHFSVEEWRRGESTCIASVRAEEWSAGPMVVRSSALVEDRADGSLAGHFKSILSVRGDAGLREAVAEVIASYGDGVADGDRVLVQPELRDVAMAGVAFGRDPATGGPYTVISYDTSGSTTTVTGGRAARTLVCSHSAPPPLPPPFDRIVLLVREVSRLFGTDRIDVEFALTHGGELYLLQARPLLGVRDSGLSDALHEEHLARIAKAVRHGSQRHPYLHGSRSLFGVMPDWNPAEIIGIRPRPLALSLYREMVTDVVWAYQRDNYGYKRLRSFPLMQSFHGLPYVDVRVSLNSFLPKGIGSSLADRLVDFYVERLAAAPSLHDKIEFEIVLSCYSLDLAERTEPLRQAGFARAEIDELVLALRHLTNRVIEPGHALCKSDLARIEELKTRHATIMGSDLPLPSRIYWLLEDCKRYGTLPFAGLARAGFIAIQMLASLVSVGVLSRAEYDAFLRSLDTISQRLMRDSGVLGRTAFLARYGHLRPGTYDIRSPRYDEAPDRYFDWTRPASPPSGPLPQPFALTLSQLRELSRLLSAHELATDPIALFDFITMGIESRESSKFAFTRSLSDALSLLGEFGQGLGFSLDDLSYLDISVVRELCVQSYDARDLLRRSIDSGRQNYELCKAIALPPLITSEQDVWAFSVPDSAPNFITQGECVGETRGGDLTDQDLSGTIVLIPSADPGYDWIFTKSIMGLVTAFGGANSHMAIRAGELGIPAVIGAGDALFGRCMQARVLRIDCANRIVEAVR